MSPDIFYFSVDKVLHYERFAHDFGPYNLGCTFRFCELLSRYIKEHSPKRVALVVRHNDEDISNAIFLLGAFLIMKKDFNLVETCKCFEIILGGIKPFCDVSPDKYHFDLHVRDCWAGLHRAKSLNWVQFTPGGFDVEEYEELDCPLNADMHQIIPGKLFAMRGPKDLGPDRFLDVPAKDGSFSHREFSPAHYADILQQFDVDLVVRLNEPHYPASDFLSRGIAVADLPFEDCTTPSVGVAAQFLALVESHRGAIAVHCKAGLGRTGTLIALHLVKSHGFTAREAMGYLRLARPGSVIGAQQDFLCRREPVMRRHRGRPLALPAPPPPPRAGVAAVQAFVDATLAHYRGCFQELAASLGHGAAALLGRADDVDADGGGDGGEGGGEGGGAPGRNADLASRVGDAVDKRGAARARRASTDDGDSRRPATPPGARPRRQSECGGACAPRGVT